MLSPWLNPLPLVVILRGIRPDEAVSIGHALADAGFRVLEVPLNSPQPMESIRRLTQSLGDGYLIGAGTVMTPAQVDEVAAAGGRLIVMPHADTAVIRAAKAAGMVCVPGVATPTEAFAALAAGADGLKLFPADQVSPAALKAWRAVLPKELPVLPVGGIAPDNMAAWVAAGAQGFGIGAALYAPGLDADEVASRAHAFAQAWAAVSPKSQEHRA
ncbi:2-dehydro-3-deoxy-6-phosphogalactonate aldolase [Rhodanobacter panaciterrae]|uniref:2-dehydro-3-deoxy-6-phosphogalactonate aldolase n=1 Tax=Rhodanobacter panaciterrae TaxID=490572 RepID=A0ABQ2ZW01_9GAMM|nr:2-dehydro-3-deoxy-6-phosphogalactonate aldolase [Rhodanobacter panaciterrae]GGY26710.1 2-dehydro-3-deoxy-6-phosphogalactonate aldolase [Rhodanobacter panaciterrae]